MKSRVDRILNEINGYNIPIIEMVGLDNLLNEKIIEAKEKEKKLKKNNKKKNRVSNKETIAYQFIESELKEKDISLSNLKAIKKALNEKMNNVVVDNNNNNDLLFYEKLVDNIPNVGLIQLQRLINLKLDLIKEDDECVLKIEREDVNLYFRFVKLHSRLLNTKTSYYYDDDTRCWVYLNKKNFIKVDIDNNIIQFFVPKMRTEYTYVPQIFHSFIGSKHAEDIKERLVKTVDNLNDKLNNETNLYLAEG